MINPLVIQIQATRQRFMVLLAAIGALLYEEVNPTNETLALQEEALSAFRSSRNWLGEVLKSLNEPNPYPTSSDPTVVTVEPTTDVPVDMGAQIALLFPAGMDLIAKVKTLRAQLKTEIAGLSALWNTFPQSESQTQTLNGAVAAPFYNMGFVAAECSMCAAIEANHALGWILAANGTVATPAPSVIPPPVEDAPEPTAQTPDPSAVPPTSPNVAAPSESLPGSGTPGASTSDASTPVPQQETVSQPDSISGSPISTPSSPSDIPAASSMPSTGIETPTTSPRPDAAIVGSDAPAPSDAQALLNQIAASYPGLINSVQEALSLKQAQHIVSIYPDDTFRTTILEQLAGVQVEELDEKGATSILSVYTSFMALAVQAEDAAEKAADEAQGESLPDAGAGDPSTPLAQTPDPATQA